MFSTLANWLVGCSHRHTTFPMTCRSGRGMRQEYSRTAETYVVCLDCGARILYDWETMRMARQPVGSEKSIRARSGHRPRGMANPAPNRWFERLVHHT